MQFAAALKIHAGTTFDTDGNDCLSNKKTIAEIFKLMKYRWIWFPLLFDSIHLKIHSIENILHLMSCGLLAIYFVFCLLWVCRYCREHWVKGVLCTHSVACRECVKFHSFVKFRIVDLSLTVWQRYFILNIRSHAIH